MEQAAETEISVASRPIRAFAAHLAALFGCAQVIDAGWDHERLEPEALRQAIVHGEWPASNSSEAQARFLERLKAWMAHAPAGVVAARGGASPGEIHDLRRLLERAGLRVDFAGTTPDASNGGRECVTVLAGEREAAPLRAPDDFRVVAVMVAYNEADVIAPALEAIISQGLQVHLLDNWSTDGTDRIAAGFRGRGLLEIERIPTAGPQSRYELSRTLERIAEIAETADADWIVVNDADEARRSPWPDLTLRDAIFTVDQRGFNAIDYTDIEFEPTDDRFPDGGSLDYFSHFRFGTEPWHFLRINTWKRTGPPVSLLDSGGHEVQFEGRRVFPYKFLLKHYPVRSQRQGERKIFRERKARWTEEERAIGWHVQYDQIREGESFIRDPSALLRFDDRRFHEEFLIERLSGIGVDREGTAGSLTMPGQRFGEDTRDAGGGEAEPQSRMESANLKQATRSALAAEPASPAAQARALGEAEAQVAELQLRVRESEEREQRLIERVFEAEEGLADALATEHELRVQIGRYAQFYQALQRSRPWKMIQFLRRLLGREW